MHRTAVFLICRLNAIYCRPVTCYSSSRTSSTSTYLASCCTCFTCTTQAVC